MSDPSKKVTWCLQQEISEVGILSKSLTSPREYFVYHCNIFVFLLGCVRAVREDIWFGDWSLFGSLDPQQNGERLRVSESPAKAAGNPVTKWFGWDSTASNWFWLLFELNSWYLSISYLVLNCRCGICDPQKDKMIQDEHKHSQEIRVLNALKRSF